jgi:biotin carboxyl carrier protein
MSDNPATHRVKVDGFSFLIGEEEFSNADIIRSAPGEYNLLIGHRSANARILDMDPSTKKMTVEVEGQRFEVLIQEELDLLLEKMGFGKATAKQVKEIKAPMPGLVLGIHAEIGQDVKEGEKLLVLEAMKMENAILMPVEGRIKSVKVKPGQAVDKGQILIELE